MDPKYPPDEDPGDYDDEDEGCANRVCRQGGDSEAAGGVLGRSGAEDVEPTVRRHDAWQTRAEYNEKMRVYMKAYRARKRAK